MLECLFGSTTVEKILFYLLVNERSYASQLKEVFGLPLFSVQRTLQKLEKGGILLSYQQGKTLIYEFNPRYLFLIELKTFLQKAYSSLPDEYRLKYYEPVVRKRPRRSGKPL